MSVSSPRAIKLLYRDIFDIAPFFLRPCLSRPISAKTRLSSAGNIQNGRRLLSTTVCRRLDIHRDASRLENDVQVDSGSIGPPTTLLPLSCPGCGAPTQTVLSTEAGFYTATRKSLQKHLKPARLEEEKVLEATLEKIGRQKAEKLGLESMKKRVMTTQETETTTPLCDRCHRILHHRTGHSIEHPSIQSIGATIDESPYKYNHIYHVLDAADFPMSLLPNLYRTLDAHMRSRNRRSKAHEFKKNRIVEMSFIITRSDLLAPLKEQVDTMMPVLIEILRDALGSAIRLGNVRCVSSKRGWWTKEVKESIWERGGGGWLVGKANVGKSNLFESVFPKGHNESVNFDRFRNEARNRNFQVAERVREAEDLDYSNPLSLLPPPQEETRYPVMPIVSEMPGTTASPIRIPFGNGKGELIDLPGLSRASLEPYVKPENKLDLVMKRRVIPTKIVLTPGRSLVLGGGLIRITPKTPDQTFILHPFVPFEAHLTSTEKAIEMSQTDQRESGISSIMDPSSKAKLASAGTFPLQHDVTRKHAGPLTRKDAVGLHPSRLPFVVYAADILIEGCGWVEVVAQVRRAKRRPDPWASNSSSSQGGDRGDHDGRNNGEHDALSTHAGDGILPEPDIYPEIEIFSPEGKFVGQRMPLNASLTGGPKKESAGKRKGRPRMSVVSLKKSRAGRGLGMEK